MKCFFYITQKCTVAQKERIFSNNCNFFIFNIENYVNTKTTCNKYSFDYLHWLLKYGKLYWKDGVILAVNTSGASPQSSASHLLTFLVAQLQFLRELKLSDHRLYEVFERRLLICGNPKERNRRQIKKTCVLFAPLCITYANPFMKGSLRQRLVSCE